MNNILIGIDPGVETGVAIWLRNEQRVVAAYTYSFWETINFLTRTLLDWKITVVIEDVTQNKPTFARKGASQFEMQRISQNVGSNKRDCQLLIEWCELKGVEIIRNRPTTEKWNHELCVRHSKYQKRVSQHARDAIKLIYGR
jgi:hypothetical protein